MDLNTLLETILTKQSMIDEKLSSFEAKISTNQKLNFQGSADPSALISDTKYHVLLESYIIDDSNKVDLQSIPSNNHEVGESNVGD